MSSNTSCKIFRENCELLCTLASQSMDLKRYFSMPIDKHTKSTPMKIILKSLRDISPKSDKSYVKLIFNLVISLSICPENVKIIIKDKIIEDTVKDLLPLIKTEKDILSRKTYFTWFSKFLASFSYCKEGSTSITSQKETFNLILFCLDETSPPSKNEADLTLHLFTNILLFLTNSCQCK